VVRSEPGSGASAEADPDAPAWTHADFARAQLLLYALGPERARLDAKALGAWLALLAAAETEGEAMRFGSVDELAAALTALLGAGGKHLRLCACRRWRAALCLGAAAARLTRDTRELSRVIRRYGMRGG
jgi:hypothetical protein